MKRSESVDWAIDYFANIDGDHGKAQVAFMILRDYIIDLEERLEDYEREAGVLLSSD